MQFPKLRNCQKHNILAIASRLLAELEDEKLWQEKFGATKDKQWDILAEMVRQEIVAGETKALEDVYQLTFLLAFFS